MYELPSANLPLGSPPRASGMPRLGILLLLWVPLLGGYGVYRWLGPQMDSEAAKPSSTPIAVSTVPAIPAEWGQQVSHLDADLLQAEPNLRHAEDQIRRTLALTDNFTQARHLHAALTSLEATHQSLVRSRNNIENLEVLLKGENPK